MVMSVLSLIGAGAWAEEPKIEVHTVISPERSGDPKEDYWRQYELYGLVTNRSSQTVELLGGDITFHDASGGMLRVDSIGTAAKQDAGDRSPGERFYTEVHYIEPGQSVPFHFMRNLAVIGGAIASHRVVPRAVPLSDEAPRGVASEITDRLEGTGPSRKRVITGTLRNEGPGKCRSPAFVVAVLDPAGKIASIESRDATDDLSRTLATGESLPFRVAFPVDGDQAWRAEAKISTWVDCEPAY